MTSPKIKQDPSFIISVLKKNGIPEASALRQESDGHSTHKVKADFIGAHTGAPLPTCVSVGSDITSLHTMSCIY